MMLFPSPGPCGQQPFVGLAARFLLLAVVATWLPGGGGDPAACRAAEPPAPLDRLDPAQIPAEDRFDWQPKELLAILGTHRGRQQGAVYCLVFSGDGKWVASAGDDGAVRFWDAATLRPGPVLRSEGIEQVFALALSPDGKTLAAGERDKNGPLIRFWRLGGDAPKEWAVLRRPGAPLEKRLPRYPSGATGMLAFSPDGKTLAAAGEDKTVWLWDVSGDRPAERASFEGGQDRVEAVAFSPDGKALATAGDDQITRLWDVSGDQPRQRAALRGGHADALNAVAFSPDGKTLATASDDKTIRLWDLGGPRPRERTYLEGHTGPVKALAFSPKGGTLASAGWDNTIRLWDVGGAKPRERAVLQGPTYGTSSLAFAPDGKVLASGGLDWTVRLWDLGGARPQELVAQPGHHLPVDAVAFAPDSKALTSAGYEGSSWTVLRWEVGGRQPREQYRMPGDDVVAFSADARALAVGNSFTVVQTFVGNIHQAFVSVWRKGVDKFEEKYQCDAEWDITALAFSPDGKTLVAGIEGNAVQLWDVSGDKAVGRALLRGHAGEVQALAFSPDGKLLASGGKDKTIRLWDLGDKPTGRATLQGHTSRVAAVAFAPDGKVLATGGDDKTVRLWDLGGAKPQPGAVFEGHAGAVKAVLFAAGGKSLISAGADGRLIVWDGDGKKLRQWQFPFAVNGLALSPDGRYLATANEDGTVYIMRLPR